MIAYATNTPISIARSLGVNDYVDGGEVCRLVELGGFIVQGPITVEELLRRYGPGEYRVTIYSLDPAGLLWEVHLFDGEQVAEGNRRRSSHRDHEPVCNPS